MQNRLLSMLILAAVIVVQALVFSGTGNAEIGLSFCTYYHSESSIMTRIIQTLFVCMPIPFIVFSFQDAVNNLTQGYARLLIVRNYSRAVIFVKTYVKIALQGAGIVLTMSAMSWFMEENTRDMPYIQALHSMLTYWLMIMSIIALVIVIELFIGNQQIAWLAVNIYVVVSLFASVPVNGPLAVVCFPRRAFSGAGSMTQDSLMTILLLGIIIVTLGFIGGTKYRKMDII